MSSIKSVQNVKFSSNDPIYMDYNATTPIDPRVGEAMLLSLGMKPGISALDSRSCWGNPSSTHTFGRSAKHALETARKQVAFFLGCHSDEIVFLSGGSESINYAIRGVCLQEKHASDGKRNHIITSAIEHPAVMETCLHLQSKHGFTLTVLPVESDGKVSVKSVTEAVTSNTVLVTIMHANNEVGALQPISEIAQALQQLENKPLFHTDASQSCGKVSVDVKTLGVDLLTLAGHKLYAPKGIGALFIKRGTILEKLIFGASHESGRRAGTENVLLATGLGAACAIITSKQNTILDEEMVSYKKLRDLLLKHLRENSSVPIRVNGPLNEHERLPNTLSVSFLGLKASDILANIDGKLACSAGAACHSDTIKVSHVLKAMNVPIEYALGTLRLSVGRFTNVSQVEKAAQLLGNATQTLSSNNISKTSNKKQKT